MKIRHSSNRLSLDHAASVGEIYCQRLVTDKPVFGWATSRIFKRCVDVLCCKTASVIIAKLTSAMVVHRADNMLANHN